MAALAERHRALSTQFQTKQEEKRRLLGALEGVERELIKLTASIDAINFAGRAHTQQK
jgi:hypothetical protein